MTKKIKMTNRRLKIKNVKNKELFSHCHSEWSGAE